MRQNDVNRAVAVATGESISTIRRIGFLLAEPTTIIPDPDDESLGGRVIDWDYAYDDRTYRHRRSAR